MDRLGHSPASEITLSRYLQVSTSPSALLDLPHIRNALMSPASVCSDHNSCSKSPFVLGCINLQAIQRIYKLNLSQPK